MDNLYRNRHKNCARSVVVHETSTTTEPAVSHSTQRLCWKRDPCDCKDNKNLTYRNRRNDDTALDHNCGIATAIRLTKFNCCQDNHLSLTQWPTQFNEVGNESQRWILPENKRCYCVGATQVCASMTAVIVLRRRVAMLIKALRGDAKNCHPWRGTPGSGPSRASCGWPGRRPSALWTHVGTT